MAQKANYIIKSKGIIDIYYTHWRAINIASDLLLGPKKFITFVKEFDKKKELINEPWIEGCIYIDLDSKALLFWEIENLYQFSIRQKYLEHLKQKWKNWKVEYAEREMYDIEKKVNIAYTSNQKIDLERVDFNKLAIDSFDKYISCIVVIKRKENIVVKNLYSIREDELVLHGESIIDILDKKPNHNLKKETD